MLDRLRHASLSGLPIRSCAPSPTADFHNFPKPINSISQTFLTFHHLSNSPTLLTHLQHFWITFEKCSARFSRRLGQNIKAIRPLLNHSSPVFILLKQQITFSRERWFSNHFPALKMRSLKLTYRLNLRSCVFQLYMRRPCTTRRPCARRRTSRGSSPPWWPRSPRFGSELARTSLIAKLVNPQVGHLVKCFHVSKSADAKTNSGHKV